MRIDDKIMDRFNELIATGENLLTSSSLSSDADVIEKAHQWIASSQNLLARVLGEKSEHYKNFLAKVSGKKTLLSFIIPPMRGILKAAKEDYEKDYLFNVRYLITADIFEDLLEQSEHLVKHGYFQPATVLAGCVLEDGLRKLCRRNKIICSSSRGIDKMAIALVKEGVFPKLVQKQIQVLADLRNKAAHGEWDKFKKEDTIRMIQDVRRIMTEYFS